MYIRERLWIMTSIKRHFGSLFLAIIPSSMYKLKIFILRFMDIEVSKSSKVNVGVKFYGGGPIEIGERTWIGPNCKFYTAENKGISIGSDCDIAPDVIFVCGSHEVGDKYRRAGKGVAKQVSIGSGSWIGINTIVLGGVQIGEGVIVGASSLVDKNLNDNVLAFGIPIKIIKELK